MNFYTYAYTSCPNRCPVTDAASPVGRAVALALAQQGWHLALHCQDDSTAPALWR